VTITHALAPTQFTFEERLKWSEGFCDKELLSLLKSRLPNVANIERATPTDDRHGTDYWVRRVGTSRSLSVDVKVRSKDYAQFGSDDLALETWSVCETKVGWTRDENKETDFVVWFWTDTGRFFIVSFPILCCVFRYYWRIWKREYRIARQVTLTEDQANAWTSECVFVPRSILIETMSRWTNGQLSRN